MKNKNVISLGFAMLVCFIVKAQEKTLIKSKDTITELKTSLNVVQSVTPAHKIIICAPSKSVLNQPLYILDGVKVNSKQFSKLNPNDIEEIKVIKGVQATNLYGNQGVNGVIIISSKNEIYKDLTEEELNHKLNVSRK